MRCRLCRYMWGINKGAMLWIDMEPERSGGELLPFFSISEQLEVLDN